MRCFPFIFALAMLGSFGLARESVAQVTPPPDPAATSAPASALLPPPGTYNYQVVVRGVRDAAGLVDVAATAGGETITAKTTLQFVSTYLIAGSVTPQYVYSNTYYASTLGLTATAEPVAINLEIRPDAGAGHRTFALASLKPDGFSVRSLRSRTLALAPGSDRWVNVDGLNFAGAFALVAQMLAAGDHPVTVISAVYSSSAPYTCTNVAAQHPKDAPAADLYLSCKGGRQDANIWYDSVTLVPDKIELPYERATLFRRK